MRFKRIEVAHRGGRYPASVARDKPANRGSGRQAAGSCECVELEARKLLWRDVIPEVTTARAIDQQVSDEVADLLLRTGDVLASMRSRSRGVGGKSMRRPRAQFQAAN